MRKWLIAVTLLLGIVLGVAASVLVASMVLWLPAAVPNLYTAPAGSLTEEEKSYKERLSLYEKRADDLERLLSILIAISSVYAIALGVNAYAQAKESADKIDKVRAQVKQDADEIFKAFPVLQHMDIRIAATMHKVLALLPRMDMSERIYERMSESDREQILFYEKTMAASEYFNLYQARAMISSIFHGLGNFYGLKHVKTQDVNDLARSKFYLQRALEEDPQNIGALNDRGYLVQEIVMPPDYSEAKRYFEQSLSVDREQQRPLYNLALTYHREKNYEMSISLLNEAMKLVRWQRYQYAKRVSDMLYNRACSEARLLIQNKEKTSGNDRDATLKKAILDDLKKAFESEDSDPVLAEYFLADFEKPEGDFFLLREDPDIGPQLKERRSKIGAQQHE